MAVSEPKNRSRTTPLVYATGAMVFVAMVPFGTTEPLFRTIVGWSAGLLGVVIVALRSPRRPVPRIIALLGLVSLALVLATALPLVPFSPEIRAALQPVLERLLRPLLAEAGVSSRALALHPRAAMQGVTFAGQSVLLAIATALMMRRRVHARLLSLVLVSTGVILVVMAEVQAALGVETIYGFTSVPVTHRYEAYGPFVNPNHGVVFCALLLPPCLHLARREQGGGRLLALVALAALGQAVVTSETRAAPVVLAVALAFQGLFSRIRPLRITILAAVSAVLIGILAVGPEQAVRLYTAALFPQDSTLEWGDIFGGRLHGYRGTLALATAAPWLGVGPGGFRDGILPFRTDEAFVTIRHAHSDLLQALAEHGFPLGLAWVALLLLPLALALFTCHRRGNTRRSGWPAAYAGTLAGLYAYALVDFPFRIGALSTLAVVVGGAIVGLAARSLRAPSGPTLRRAFLTCFFGMPLVLLVMGGVLAGTRSRPRHLLGPHESTLREAERLHADFSDSPRDPEARQDATALYRLAMARRPLDPRGLLGLIAVCQHTEEEGTCSRLLRLGNRTWPVNRPLWLSRARHGQRTGNLLEAARAWRRLLALDAPDAETAERWMGEALRIHVDPALAARLVVPARADRQVLAGRILLREGAVKTAREFLQKGASLDPSLSGALVRYYMNQERWDKALEQLETLPRDCSTTTRRGQILLELHRYAEAEAALEEALAQCGSQDVRLRSWLGEARLAQGDLRGRDILERILELHPDTHHARRILMAYARERGHRTRLRKHLAYLVETGMALPHELREYRALTTPP